MALNDIKVPKENAQGTFDEVALVAATTSADGLMSSADKTKLNGIAAGAEVNVQANWTESNSANDAFILNKPATFAPSAHSSSHAVGGSDPLAPSDIGAQSIFTTQTLVLENTSQVTLTAARANIFQVLQYAGGNVNVKLPSANTLEGDVFVFRWSGGSDLVNIVQSSSPATVATLSSGESKRFIRGSTDSWSLVPVDTHTLAASAITSGTLDIARIPTGTSGTTVALGNHTHELTALAATGATNGHVLTANGSNGATFAALPASGVTGAAASASDVLGVSGANITGVDANADRIVYWNNTSNKLAYGTPADAGAAASSHTHTSADINSQTASNGHVLTANGSGGASFAALPASGISNVDSTLADVMSVSGSNLVADDGGLVDSSNPALVWDDAAGKAVWANPLRRTSSGAFYVGLAPTTTALGTNAINIQANRTNAGRLATGSGSIAIGNTAGAFAESSIVIGDGGSWNDVSAAYCTVIGFQSFCSSAASSGIVIGAISAIRAANGVCIGASIDRSLRSIFATRCFESVYWGGQTTNNTATILNLDATATNRFTIAANTALAVDILLVARRSDVADKWLVARRFLGIRRDGSNNTSLIGAVQTLGTDQSAGSPTWSFTLTADDTNEALQLEVTGAASETVQWRATAFYRVA